jgi:hypothetical protein
MDCVCIVFNKIVNYYSDTKLDNNSDYQCATQWQMHTKIPEKRGEGEKDYGNSYIIKARDGTTIYCLYK